MANVDDLLSELADIGNSPPAKDTHHSSRATAASASAPLDFSRTPSFHAARTQETAVESTSATLSTYEHSYAHEQQPTAAASGSAVDDLLSMIGDVDGSSGGHGSSAQVSSGAVQQADHNARGAKAYTRRTEKTKCVPATPARFCIRLHITFHLCLGVSVYTWGMQHPWRVAAPPLDQSKCPAQMRMFCSCKSRLRHLVY